MATCDHCGDAVDHLLECSHCGREHCLTCRLPEAHDCVLHHPTTDRVFESAGPEIRERGTGRSRVVGSQPEGESEQTVTTCADCGRRIAPTERRCAACRPGTPTPDHHRDPPQVRAPPPPADGSSRRYVDVVLLAALAVAAIGLAVLLLL